MTCNKIFIPLLVIKTGSNIYQILAKADTIYKKNLYKLYKVISNFINVYLLRAIKSSYLQAILYSNAT